ncbi:MAG: AMP-binding enzyme, partial [Bacteroidia bacterium]
DKNSFVLKAAVVSSVTEDEQVTILAFVVLKESAEKSVIKMKEYCMKHLPSYMIPNDFIFANELPYTSSNKIDYQKLKQIA